VINQVFIENGLFIRKTKENIKKMVRLSAKLNSSFGTDAAVKRFKASALANTYKP